MDSSTETPTKETLLTQKDNVDRLLELANKVAVLELNEALSVDVFERAFQIEFGVSFSSF